ncbi:C2 domain-containing protein [Mrakia frigida]|uniref:C2 domain-containing protein n=1 Tax=Mrakia frigida TaxID=29902 RepID=UPI003FCC1D23
MPSSPNSSTTDQRKKLGELVVVVLRARHLTNVKLSKQDPYCSLTINTEKRRTAAIKKGGQHPEWDEQLKFDIYEDMQDQLLRTSTSSKSSGDPDSLGKSSGAKKEGKKVFEKGAKTMRVACYADAPREPELIGEAVFDLAKALNTGEDDDWVTINRKDRYAGEIFIEFTYFIAVRSITSARLFIPLSSSSPSFRVFGSFR